MWWTQVRGGMHRTKVRRRFIGPWSEEERIGSKSEEETRTQFRRGTHRIKVRRRFTGPRSEGQRRGSKSEEDI